MSVFLNHDCADSFRSPGIELFQVAHNVLESRSNVCALMRCSKGIVSFNLINEPYSIERNCVVGGVVALMPACSFEL